MKIKKYRVVKDNYNGFEAQVWRWWFPFWIECFFSNTSGTLDDAKEVIEAHKSPALYSE